MKSVAALAAYFLVAVTTATPDPLITPRAELAPQQTSSESDAALVGWIDATDGQCKLRLALQHAHYTSPSSNQNN